MKVLTMKSGSASFLQAFVVLVGLCALVFLLGEPHLEGRNAQATLAEIYFKDPFLAYVYVGSIPLFVALHRAFALFGDLGRTGSFSPAAVKALGVIKRCAIVMIGFVAGGVIIILLNGDGEDRPAGIFMSALIAFPAIVVALLAATFERRLATPLETRSEA